MSNLPLVLLLGSNGKLGSEFKSRFTCEGINYLAIDTRLSDWQEKITKTKKIVLDVSGRNRNFGDLKNPQTGQMNKMKFLNFIATTKTPYLKLASAFILYDENPRNSYAAQSSLEVKVLLQQTEKSAFPLYILYTHAVFGGKSTDSFVDQLKVNQTKLNPDFSLDNPYDVRDFIHFDLLYRSVVDSLPAILEMAPTVLRAELGTGCGYQLQDLLMYAGRKIDVLAPRIEPGKDSHELLIGQRVIVAGKSNEKIQVIYLEDKLVNYLR